MPRADSVAWRSEELNKTFSANDSRDRVSPLRRTLPGALAAAGIGTFIGIAIGSLFLPALAPEGVGPLLVLLVAFVLLVSGLILAAGRWLPDHLLYPTYRLAGIVAVLLYVPILILGPHATALIMIAAIGFPLVASHFLRGRDLVFLLVVWSFAVVGSYLAVQDEPGSADVTALVIAVVPTTWLLVAITRAQTVVRFRELRSANRQALTDPLTGLANRRGLLAFGDEMLGDAQRSSALLLIDLDDFKSANTLYGHAGGDHVLRVVAARLEAAAGADDLVARLGGDEFVVVQRVARDIDISALEDRYTNAVASASTLSGLDGVRVSGTVGGAVPDGVNTSVEPLLRVAQERLSAKKARRRSQPRPVSQLNQIRPLPESARAEDADSTSAAKRPPIVTQPAFGLLLASLVLLVATPFTDVDSERKLVVAAIAALGLLASGLIQLAGLELGRVAASIADFCGYLLVAVLAYLTGGTNGPALPLLFVLIAYDAWRASTRGMAVRFVLAQAAVYSTLLYENPPTSVEQQAAYGVIAALSVMITIVTVLMVRHNWLMRRVRSAAEHQADHDKLTGVLNRRAFERLTAQAIEAGEPFAVVMIDLDNFKTVNTEEGYEGGDRVLAAIGRRLLSATRAEDSVGRVGGDEFGALLAGASEVDLQAAATRFMEAVDLAASEHSSVAARNVSASCGIATFPEHGENFEQLMLAADDALMRVKASGKRAARLHRIERSA